MTARERILQLSKSIEKEATKQYEIGIHALRNAAEGLDISRKLQEAVMAATDEECEGVVATWDKEKAGFIPGQETPAKPSSNMN